ncbi:MAG: UDPglucose 6-dehydrogenase, partial [Actinomycetota bacterium]|nr:UDPglucose 6-dehydrogenase [Actinomycetota bacterium]
FDPMANREVKGVEMCQDAYAAAEGADVLAVMTEWEEFRYLDMGKVHNLMKVPTIVDARNLLDPAALRRRGFAYTGVGR